MVRVASVCTVQPNMVGERFLTSPVHHAYCHSQYHAQFAPYLDHKPFSDALYTALLLSLTFLLMRFALPNFSFHTKFSNLQRELDLTCLCHSEIEHH